MAHGAPREGQTWRVNEGSSADELVGAIRAGDLDGGARLVAFAHGLAGSRLGGRHGARTSLHVVADWPGYWPNAPQIVRILVAAGADPNARDPEPRSETPLHWAASSDDADVARTLIEFGAEVNGPAGSIGSPLENAVGYGCWNVARVLVERGARVERMWVAAALGMLDRLRELVADGPVDDVEGWSQALWHACNGGQRRVAEYLVGIGADVNWLPDYGRGGPRSTRRSSSVRSSRTSSNGFENRVATPLMSVSDDDAVNAPQHMVGGLGW